MAQLIGDEQPVYGVHSVGLDGREEPLRTVEEMVGRYSAEIRAVRPHGPYRFAGYCFGAYLALELAASFEEAGDEVDLVVCFDTDGLWRTVDSASADLRNHFNLLSGMSARRRMGYVRDRLAYRAWRLRCGVQSLAGKLSAKVGLPPAPQALMIRVRELNIKASRLYQPRPIHARFLFVRPEGAQFADPLPFWRPLAGSGVTERRVSGAGFEMFDEPHVRDVAQAMEPFLGPARRGDP